MPLRRVGDKGRGIEAFEPIGWDQALDAVAEGFLEAERRHGPEAVWPYFFAGTMGHVQRDGIERLRHVKGYSRQHSTICTTLPDAGWLAGVGVVRGVTSSEIAEADLIVVWGGNPVATQVNVMTHVARARKTRRAKLVVVDPYRTGTAEQADLHLAPRPGTDGALAVAMIHVLLRDGLADRDYLARNSDWTAEIEAHFAARSPAWAAEITGLSVAEIEAFARLYGATERSFIRAGYGFARSRNGAANMHAVTCLPTVTGAWRHHGGGALYANRAVYPLYKTLIEGLDKSDRSTRLLDQSRIGPILTGERRDLGDGPPVTALLIQNTNPARGLPGKPRGAPGLRTGRSLHLRPRAVHDRDRGVRGYRAAGHDFSGARRHLYRQRPLVPAGRAQGDRAAGPLPDQPFRPLRAREAARRRASRLRHEREADHRRHAQGLGPARRRHPPRGALVGLLAAVRRGPFP